MNDLFDIPSRKLLRKLRKYSPDQPRDEDGKWSAGGVARAVGRTALTTGAVLAGVAGAAALGHPGSRAALNIVRSGAGDNIRRAAIGARTARARNLSPSTYINRGGTDMEREALRTLARLGAMSPRGPYEVPRMNALRAVTGNISPAGARRAMAAGGGIARPKRPGVIRSKRPGSR